MRYPEPQPITGLPGAIIGVFTGLVYGVLLWMALVVLLERDLTAVIAWCSVGFGIVGWFNGNVIFELTLAVLHFVWGLLHGLAETEDFRPDRGAGKLLETITIVGFVSGAAILLAWYSL